VQCYPDNFSDALNMHVPYCDVHLSVMNYQKKKMKIVLGSACGCSILIEEFAS